MLPGLLNALRSLPAYRALSGALPRRAQAVHLGGLPGSSPAALVAALAEDLPQRVLLVVAETPSDAERWLADLAVLRDGGARLYPQREALGEEEPHLEIAGERVETIEAVLSGQARVVVTPVRATAERTTASTAQRTAITTRAGEGTRSCSSGFRKPACASIVRYSPNV